MYLIRCKLNDFVCLESVGEWTPCQCDVNIALFFQVSVKDAWIHRLSPLIGSNWDWVVLFQVGKINISIWVNYLKGVTADPFKRWNLLQGKAIYCVI